MGKYKEKRGIVFEVLSDREWHTIDEIQKKCEEKGIFLNGERSAIYNVMHQLKKKGMLETSGTGKYKMSDENIQNDNKKEADQENCHKQEDKLGKSIKSIEIYLIKYKKFDWITCSEKELQEARANANKLIKLSEKIQNEFSGKWKNN